MGINKATLDVSNAIAELEWLLGNDVDYKDIVKALEVSGLISSKLARDLEKYDDDDTYNEEEHLGCQNFPVCDTEGCGGGK
jgi:hypothetical protein